MNSDIEGPSRRCPNCFELRSNDDIVCKSCGTSLIDNEPVNTGVSRKSGFLKRTDGNLNFTGDISKTVTGLLLLAIGTAISWIPFIEYLGILLNLIGVIFIYMGRQNFSSSHSTFVILSIIVYLIGAVFTFVVALSLVSQIVSSSVLSPQVTKGAITSDITTFIYAEIVGVIIMSMAFFLITFALQDKVGKFLLVLSVVVYIFVEIIIAGILVSQISQAISQAFSGSTYNKVPIANLEGNLTSYSLLAAVPMLIYAISYFRLYMQLKEESSNNVV
ncbi:MAG: hypothetical protein ACYDAO_06385 [Thermoplasmataceae archaeon]